MDFPGHFEQIFQQLNYQRVHGQLCDCVIVVGNRHFKAHRAVLAACSTHFRALFTVAEGDASMSMIQLDSEVVTAEAFAALVDMMYTSTLMLGESNVMDVLLAASHLHLNTVVKACKHYLTTRTLPMSPPGEHGSQHSGSQVAAAANSRLQRSFLLQQLGLSLVNSALGGTEEEGAGAGRGAGSVSSGSVSGSGLAEQRDGFPSRRFHKRKQGFSLIRSESERLRQRPRLSSPVEGTLREGECRMGGDEILSPDSHNKVVEEDFKLDVVVARVVSGDSSDLLNGRDYRRSTGQEDVQLPSQSDGGRGNGVEQPLMLPRKEEAKDGGEDDEAPQVVVKSEPLSSPEPVDETSDVTSQAEGSDQVEATGEKLELSPGGSDHSFTEAQPSSDLLLTGVKGPTGGVERGVGVGVGREELSCSDTLDSGFRISSFLSTKGFECGTLSSNSAENVPNTTTGECRLDRDPARFLFDSDLASTSSSLHLPPSQSLLSGDVQDFPALPPEALLLRPMHDGLASSSSSSSFGNSRGASAEQLTLSFQRNSLGLHTLPRLSRGGGSGFPSYRRIAPKLAGGGSSMRTDGAHLQDVASSSSSSSAMPNGTGFDGTASGGQQRGNNFASNPPPQLTRASADVLSKCKKALSEHNVLVVEGARKYACKICCKTFLTLTDCKKHIRVHTGEKPYACLKCGKRFSQSSHLYKHSKTTCLRWQSSNMSNALL